MCNSSANRRGRALKWLHGRCAIIGLPSKVATYVWLIMPMIKPKLFCCISFAELAFAD